jgi:hypothetical protein
MKSLLTALACAAALSGPAACGRSDEQQVRKTVEQYIKARNEGDFARVCDLFDQGYRAEQGLAAGCEQSLASQAAGQPPPGQTKIVSVRVHGDKANAELDASHGSEGPSRVSLVLVRHDGGWRIASST